MHPYAYRLLVAAFLASLLAALGCGEEKLHDCIDGVDNDNDGLVDSNDLGCFVHRTAEGPDRVSGICADGIDNDGDGLADFPEDPGCYDREDGDERNTSTAVCRDGIDNDGDGLADYPNDPGCFSSLTDDESDGCPDDPRCPQCKNGLDDDGDGTADFPVDPGCDSAADALEDKATTTDCGTQAVVTPLPASGFDRGTFAEGARGELVSATCGGTGTETVYTFEVAEPRVLLATTVVAGSPVDTVLYVRDDCRDTETEQGCNDDADPAGYGSTLQVELTPGAYFLVVDAHNPTVVGNYELQAALYTAPGAPCDPENPECLPDYVCRPRDTSTTETTCELPSCVDGIDNEGDGLIDYPNDPGCIAPTDNDEADSCPGTGCPACANGVDDDSDGVADYPGDVGCTAASDVDEVGCLEETDPVEYINSTVTAGDTTSAGDDFTPFCGFSFDAGDRTHQLNVNVPLESLLIEAVSTGFETILSVRSQGCDGTEIACSPSDATLTSRIDLVNVAAGSYFVTVDGAFDVEGSYELRVRGVIPAGSACDPTQEASGLFVCTSGYTCAVDTCVIAACSDDQDNDGDGYVDYPFDPGCSTPSDNNETDECPTGAGCPLCGNSTDDDGDGDSDYPGDLGCQSAGDNDEIDECIAGVPLLALEDSVTGVTPSAPSSFTPSCSDDTGASESVYVFQLGRELASLTFTSSSLQGDAVLSVRAPECGEASSELACSNNSAGGNESITLTNPDQGSYYVFVDGYFSAGPVQYQLDVRGIIGEGSSCDPTDTQFVCAAGMVCDPVVNVCRLAQCNNGINDDPDEDTLVDELDTGCISSIDDSESPSPAQAPQCADGVDNDIDGTTDYPGDQGCQAAGDNSEVNCSDNDPLVTIAGPVTVGTTAQAANDFVPYCASSSFAPDVVHELRVPGKLASLSANTFGSTFDTVLLLKRNTCAGNGITCNNNAAPGVLQSQITASNLNPGTYFLFVDGAGAAAGNYLLNVTGVIAQGEVCDPAQISSGLFSCIGTTTCSDTGSGFICQ